MYYRFRLGNDYFPFKQIKNCVIGTELLGKAQEYATEKNISQIHLHVEKSNSDAIRLYQHLGYKVINEENTRFLMVKMLEKIDFRIKYKSMDSYGKI